jgi:hypothetical protein
MLRFPYRRVLAEPRTIVSSQPLGLWSRLIRLLTGELTAAQPTTRVSDSAPRPVVSIRIRGPVASRRLKSALLDTGSQDTPFPAALAEPLGVPLGGERQTIRWRGQRYWVEFQTVELELAQEQVAWRWQARVGFTPAPLAYALLGHRGCLDFLDAKFCGADQIVEIEVNRMFPGIVGPRA